MDDDSFGFRQKGAGVPRGIEATAEDADPSEQSGQFAARLGAPVWRQFVANEAFQEENKAAVAAEQAYQQRTARTNAVASRQQAEKWGGDNGRLFQQVGKRITPHDPMRFVDHPEIGPVARKTLWDQEVRKTRTQHEALSLQLQDPALQESRLSPKQREEAAQELSAWDSSATDKANDEATRQQAKEQADKVKARLAKADEVEKMHADAYQAKVNAFALENTDPEAWWQSRPVPTGQEQRQAVVGEVQAKRADVAAADDSVSQEMADLRAKLATGVKGTEADAAQARLNELAQASATIANVKQENEAKLEPVKQEAAAEASRGFFSNTATALKRGYAGASQASNILQGATDQVNAEDIVRYEKMKRENPASKEFQDFMQAKGFADSALAFMRNPVRIISEVIAESAAQMAPSIALGIAGGSIGGAIVAAPTGEAAAPATVPIGAAVGSAVGAGSGSALAEYGSSMMQAMEEAGMDATDPESIKAFFGDPEKLAKARDFAVKRGVAVGLFDAVSAGLAGKFLKSVQVAAKGGQKVGVGAVLSASGKEVGMQAGAGATGEAAGQLASTGDITDAKSIFLEGIAEVGSAPLEVASNLRDFSKDAPPTPVQDLASKVDAHIASIDPEAAPSTPEEIRLATLIHDPAAGVPGLGDSVMIERELKGVSQQDAQSVADAQAAYDAILPTGDKPGTAATEAALETAKANAGRADRVRAVLKITSGQGLADLTDSEARSLGWEKVAPKDGGEPTFKPLDAKGLEAQGLTQPLVHPGDDGSPIVLDEAIAQVKAASPRAGARIKLSEAEQIAAAKQRASIPAWTVSLASGKTVTVRAADAASAETRVAGDIPLGGDSVVPGSAKAHGKNTQGSTENQGGTAAQVPVPPVPEGTGGTANAGTAGGGTAATPPPQTPAQGAVKSARALVKRAQKNKRLAAALREGQQRAVTTPDAIEVNPEQIINEAVAAGMTPKQALQYFERVLDEEVRHLAQYDAARALWESAGSPGEFTAWMGDYYGKLWTSEFTGEKADIARTIYAKGNAEAEARWDAMADADKAMEAIRMMSQGENVTEAAKLWINIGQALRQALEAALLALKQFTDTASPAILSEIKHLEHALKQLRKQDLRNRPKKPSTGKAGAGNSVTPETGGDSGTGGNGGVEPSPSDNAGAFAVGQRVRFTRDGEELTGVISVGEKSGMVMVRLDKPTHDGLPTKLVRVGELTVVAKTPVSPAGETPEVKPEVSNDTSTYNFTSRKEAVAWMKKNGISNGRLTQTDSELFHLEVPSGDYPLPFGWYKMENDWRYTTVSDPDYGFGLQGPFSRQYVQDTEGISAQELAKREKAATSPAPSPEITPNPNPQTNGSQEKQADAQAQEGQVLNQAPGVEAPGALSPAEEKARKVIEGLFAAGLPETFTKTIPQDRFMALMDAANSLVSEGVDTPEKLAATMEKLAPDRKAVPFTQSFWFALKAVGVEGAAEPEWAVIYKPEREVVESAGTPDAETQREFQAILPGMGKFSKRLEGMRKAVEDRISQIESENESLPYNKQKDTGRLEALLSRIDRGMAKNGLTQPVVAAPPVNASKSPSKGITDFGEKLEGARKDLWGSFKKAISEEIPEDVADIAISKSFPEPDYALAIENGIPVNALATFKAIRDKIPAKPRKSWKLDNWVKMVRGIHPLMQKLAAGNELSQSEIETIQKLFRGGGLLSERIELYQDLGFPAFTKAGDWKILSHVSVFYDGEKKLDKPEKQTAALYKDRFVSGMYSKEEDRRGYVDVLDKIRARILSELEQPSEKKAKPVEFQLYRDRFTREVYIGKKAVNGVIRMQAGFADVKEARTYLADNQAQLEEQWAGMKVKPDYRRQVNALRQGPTRREGDATPESFQDAFGFRGVQFGNWVEDGRRQVDINEAFDAFMDLADALGIPPKAVSLDGSLGLAFGARGHAGAAAHYEPGQVVINLTKMSGPGSLGHEWFHAFDNYFARLDKTGETKAKALDSFATTNTGAPKNMRPEVWAAFKQIRSVLEKGPFAERSKKLDDTKSKPYYGTTIEKAARAFERYTVNRLETKEISNDYLVNIAKDFSPALPTPEEMDSGIRQAYDNLFNILDAKETPTGTALQAAPLPASPFYSQLERVVSTKVSNNSTPAQVLATIMAGNVKAEEIKWSGIIPKLQELGPKVDKSALLEYLRGEGAVRFEEVTLGSSNSLAWETNGKYSHAKQGEWNFNIEAMSNGKFRLATLAGVNSTHPTLEAAKSEAESIRKNVGHAAQDAPTKFSTYQLPGGENYREVVMAMPKRDVFDPSKVRIERIRNSVTQGMAQIYYDGKKMGPAYGDSAGIETNWQHPDSVWMEHARKMFYSGDEHNGVDKTSGDYASSHFPDVPNYVAHMRTNERTDATGAPGLFIEELQSDRHQAGKKEGYAGELPAGYTAEPFIYSDGSDSGEWVVRDSDGNFNGAHPTKEDAIANRIKQLGGIPDAPHRKDWSLALFKRALRDAVAEGKTWIGWTSGETQNERYDLSKQVDNVMLTDWPASGKDMAILTAHKGTAQVIKETINKNDLADYIGKDAAEKLLNAKDEGMGVRTISGDDLKVGGKGMTGFYDQILPKEIGKYVKQWGAKVERGVLKDAADYKSRKPRYEGPVPTIEEIIKVKNSTGLSQEERIQDIADSMEDGNSFENSIIAHGTESDAKLFGGKLTVDSPDTPIWRVTITPEMRKGVEAGQTLFSAPLPPINPTLATEARSIQEWSGKNVSDPRFAAFGSDATRKDLDVVTAIYDYERERRSNAEALDVARQRLKDDPADINAKLVDAVTTRQRQLDTADHLAIQLSIDQETAAAGNDTARQAANMARMLAYRKMRGDVGRLLQIGVDRFMTPAERALAALTDAIYTPSKRLGKLPEQMPTKESNAVIEQECKKRIAEVEKALDKMGLKLSDIRAANQRLKLQNSEMMKEVLRLKSSLEQDFIKLIQKGWTLPEIVKRYGRKVGEEVQAALSKARAELTAKLTSMMQQGMTDEQIRAELGDSLKAAPLGQSSGQSADAIKARIERMLVEDFGLPETVPMKRKLPRIKKADSTLTESQIAQKEKESADKIAQKIIDRITDNRANPKPKRETDAIHVLVRRYAVKHFFGFKRKLRELGVSEPLIKSLEEELSAEREINAERRKTKKEKPIETNPLEAQWTRPVFEDGMKSFKFDTTDRANIMRRFETIHDLAHVVGKISKLEGDNLAKANTLLAEIDGILAKYGTDTRGIFEAAKPIEDYGFDMTDVVQVSAVARAIHAIDADIIDKATEWVYASILSGFQTMAVNATAAGNLLWENTVGRGVEMAINHAIVHDPMGATMGEEKYILRAIRPALVRAMNNARVSFAAQHPMFDRDVNAMEVDWDRATGGVGNQKMIGAIGGKFGDIVRIPMRVLVSTDDFNNTLFACATVGTYAYRLAKQESLKQGSPLFGKKPGSPEFDRFIREMVNMPGSAAYALASQKSRAGQFANPLPGQRDPHTGKAVPTHDIGDFFGWVGGQLTSIVNKEQDNLLGKTLMAAFRVSFFPFQRTPFNILRKGIRYVPNPVSLFDILIAGNWHNKRVVGESMFSKKGWGKNLHGRNAELIERAAMQLQGSIAMLLLMGLGAGEGDDDDMKKPVVITGSMPWTPRGKAELATQQRVGMGPYRVSFRNKDGRERFGFDYGRIEPLATLAAGMIDLTKNVKRTLRGGGDASQAAGAALGGLVAQAKDKTFLRGMSDLVDLGTNLLAEPDLRDNRKMQQFMAGRFAMAIPNFVKQPIREADSHFRERSDSFMEELLYQAAPIGQKPEKLDPYGKPMEKAGTPLARTVDFTSAGTNAVNPADAMLLRWRDKHPDKAWFPSSITNAEWKHRVTGKTEKMTGDQLEEFRAMAGKRAAALMKLETFNFSNPGERDVKKLKALHSQAREDAKKLLTIKFSAQKAG